MTPPSSPAPSRLQSLLTANIRGTHAYQLLLARTQQHDSPPWSTDLPTPALQLLVDSHKSLLSTPPAVLKAWIAGQPAPFDSAAHLTPLLTASLPLPDTLPVEIFTAFLAQKSNSDPARLRSLANLLQVMLETKRDAVDLQHLFTLYTALGLPVYTGQFPALPATDAGFLDLARELSPKLPPSPFKTAPENLQMIFRKMWNWGQRHLGIRDKTTLARELLAEPDVYSLLPAIRSLPPRKIAVIGHSFTMDLHWSSPASFVSIVQEIFRLENPAIQFELFQAGGLTAWYAREIYYDKALASRPDQLLLVTLLDREKDEQSLAAMLQDFAAHGIPVHLFDDLGDPNSSVTAPRRAAIARSAGAALLPLHPLLATAQAREQFLSLDRVHMTEPYHRLMASHWLHYLLAVDPATASSFDPLRGGL